MMAVAPQKMVLGQPMTAASPMISAKQP